MGKKVLLVILIMISFSLCAQEYIAVFGQSNAKITLALAISREIPKYKTINQYHPGESIYNWFDEKIRDNLFSDLKLCQNRQIKYVVWFQGETDRNMSSLYKVRFLNLFEVYRQYVNPDIVFIICQVWMSDGRTDNIRARQQELAEENTGVYIIDTAGYDRVDGIHLTDFEYSRLGKDIAAFIQELEL